MMAMRALRALAYPITLFVQPPYQSVYETAEKQPKDNKQKHYHAVIVSHPAGLVLAGEYMAIT